MRADSCSEPQSPYKLGLGCVPIRKKGKLPFKTIGSSYQLEYGGAKVEMHVALHSADTFSAKCFAQCGMPMIWIGVG